MVKSDVMGMDNSLQPSALVAVPYADDSPSSVSDDRAASHGQDVGRKIQPLRK